MSADLRTEARKRKYEMEVLNGIAARQVGKLATANPFAGKPSLIDLYEQWMIGWQRENNRETGSR